VRLEQGPEALRGSVAGVEECSRETVTSYAIHL
jgi:hypothetical protein